MRIFMWICINNIVIICLWECHSWMFFLEDEPQYMLVFILGVFLLLSLAHIWYGNYRRLLYYTIHGLKLSGRIIKQALNNPVYRPRGRFFYYNTVVRFMEQGMNNTLSELLSRLFTARPLPSPAFQCGGLF